MLAIVFIALILGPSQLINADESSSIKSEGELQTAIEKNATSSTSQGEILSTTSLPSTTFSSLSSKPTPKPDLPSKTHHLPPNVTNVEKSDEVRNSSLEDQQPHDTSEKINTVVTEGGNDVKTLDKSGTNFEGIHENPQKTVVAEGGVLESAGEKMSNSTTAPIRVELDPHQPVIEGISSMNEGKIIARKGVVLENSTTGDNDVHKTGDVGSPVNDNTSTIRKPKPAVTDDKDESIGDYIRKMDYIIPIVCTVFSVPLLIVLAIYLYKRGADLWERRHYNRMDFLIEGMYND